VALRQPHTPNLAQHPALVAPSVDNYGLNTQTAAQPRAKANLFAAMRRRAGAWRKWTHKSSIKWGNSTWFYSVKQAQVAINIWLKEYNHIRPYHALGMRPPVPETLLEKREFMVQKLGLDKNSEPLQSWIAEMKPECLLM